MCHLNQKIPFKTPNTGKWHEQWLNFTYENLEDGSSQQWFSLSSRSCYWLTFKSLTLTPTMRTSSALQSTWDNWLSYVFLLPLKKTHTLISTTAILPFDGIVWVRVILSPSTLEPCSYGAGKFIILLRKGGSCVSCTTYTVMCLRHSLFLEDDPQFEVP